MRSIHTLDRVFIPKDIWHCIPKDIRDPMFEFNKINSVLYEI